MAVMSAAKHAVMINVKMAVLSTEPVYAQATASTAATTTALASPPKAAKTAWMKMVHANVLKIAKMVAMPQVRNAIARRRV